jgi:hypothetical protein
MGSFELLAPYGSAFLWDPAEFLPAPQDFSGSFTDLAAAVQGLVNSTGALPGGAFVDRVLASKNGVIYSLSCSFYFGFTKNTFQQMGSFDTVDAYARAPFAVSALVEGASKPAAVDAISEVIGNIQTANDNGIVWDIVTLYNTGTGDYEAAAIWYDSPEKAYGATSGPGFQNMAAHAFMPKARGLRVVEGRAEPNPSAAVVSALNELATATPNLLPVIWRHGVTLAGGGYTCWIVYLSQASEAWDPK